MMTMTKQMRKNSYIFESKRVFSAYRPADEVSNHKRVDPLPKISVRISSKINIAKNINLIQSFFENNKVKSQDCKMIFRLDGEIKQYY